MSEQRSVTILGSTGSIGTQAIDVITRNPALFRVPAIAAGGRDLALLAQQAVQLKVDVVGIARESGAAELRERLVALGAGHVEVVAGSSATAELAERDADVVLNAVDGAQGLNATLAALKAGRFLALANKESLVAGGPLVKAIAKPGQITPVDSEHSAIAQCLRSGAAGEVHKLIVTASGGPFRGKSRAEMRDVTPQQALAHPTWDMGKLVTTNSATLVNKGLEVIEAHLLFDVPYDRIEAVVHPQSIVHSMVEFTDGSTIAQAAPPDMRQTISLAIGWPDRVAGAASPLDWTQAQAWTFEPLDEQAFPAVSLAKQAGRAGGCAPAVLNAANEELVAAFHNGSIGFLQIVDTIGDVLAEWLSEQHEIVGVPGTVEEIEQAQLWARRRADELTAART